MKKIETKSWLIISCLLISVIALFVQSDTSENLTSITDDNVARQMDSDDSALWDIGGHGQFTGVISGYTVFEGESVSFQSLPMDPTNEWYVMNNNTPATFSGSGSIDLTIAYTGQNMLESQSYSIKSWLWSFDENGTMYRHTNSKTLDIDLVTGQTSFSDNYTIKMIDIPDGPSSQIVRPNGCYWVEYWVYEQAPQTPGHILPGGKTDMVSFGLPCPTDDTGDSGNETNDGGDEPQYGNCSNILGLLGDSPLQDGLHVCDEETGEWVLVTTKHPHGIVLRDEKDRFAGYLSPQDFREIGCDEEPTEGQLNETNLADLLNEHDEILVVKGNDTFYMAAGPTISLLDLRDEFAIEHPPSVLLVYEKEDDKFQGSIYLYNFHRAYGDQGFRVSFMTMIEDNGQGSYSGIAGVLSQTEFLKLNAGRSRHTWAFLVETDENGTVTNVNFIKRDVESCPSDNMVGQFDWDRDSDEIRDNFDENETEDESSGILVAAGGVEVTTRDAAVAGVGLLIGIGCSVITRWLRPKQRVDLGRAGDAKDAYDLISIKNQLDEIDSAEGEPLLKDLFVQDEY